MNKKIIAAVLWIHKETEGKVVFAGSFGLVLNGKLNRAVEDLDVFTDFNYYGDRACVDLNRESSGKFAVDGEEVQCVNGRAPNGVKVDFMWKRKPLEYDEIEFHGVTIRVEKPEHAINAKRNYVGVSRAHREKHETDLKEIDKQIFPGNPDDLPF